MSESQKTGKNSSARIYLRILITVLILACITVIAVFWALNSAGFARSAFDYLARQSEADAIKLSCEDLSGTILDGINIKRLNLVSPSSGFGARVENISAVFDFTKLTVKGRIELNVDCEKIDVQVGSSFPWLKTVPPFPNIGCLVDLPANLFLSRLKAKEASFYPADFKDLRLNFNDVSLVEPDEKNIQKLQLNYQALFKQREFLKGDFSGSLTQRNKKIEGRVDACVAGQKFASELVLASKHGKFEISGHIIKGMIDLAVFSRWLIPLWQDAFPFGFDGLIGLSGSWYYGETLGFLGNIDGNFSKVRMVAQGLFITIFELNGNWKLFDGNLELTDSGSFFAGFPAHLNGKIESVFSPARKWNIDFSADAIDMNRFYDDLPWGVKYGMGLPNMTGTASFRLQLKGVRPEIAASLKAQPAVRVEKDSFANSISGEISFKLGVKDQGYWTVNTSCKPVRGIPGLLNRFRRNGQTLAGKFADHSFAELNCRGKGTLLPALELDCNVKTTDARVVSFNGALHDGNGHLVVSGNGEEFAGFSGSNLTLLQLLLGY